MEHGSPKKNVTFLKIPIKSGLWDLFIYISCHQNDVSQKNPMGESGENPQNLFSSISPKKTINQALLEYTNIL